MVQETTEKVIQIKQRIQAARNQQKRYADLKRKPMEFQVGDRVMLKVSPWKGVVHFGKRAKLNPRYVGTFKVLAKVGAVAYKLELPQELSRVHSTFHVSKLKKCYSDEPLAVSLEGLHIDDKLYFTRQATKEREGDKNKHVRHVISLLTQSKVQPNMSPKPDHTPRRAPFARELGSRRAHLLEPPTNPNRNAKHTTDAPMSVAAINQLIETRVAEALANQEQLRNNGVNGDGSQNSRSGTERPTRTPRECTFKDFLNCQPLTFKGTEGVVGLTQWFEKMESVFHISNCTVENQVKFATCTLLGATLTWWNSHVKTVGHDAAYGMPWKTLMKMMTVKYCPRSEIKKLEIKIWNLKVKGTDVVGYTQRFQELALMCGRMFPEESDEVEKYVGGLPDMIQGNVMSARPKTMQEAIELANDLMDQKVRAYAERQAENKRKFDNNNQAQQQLPKRQNVVQAYTVGSGEKKEYVGTLPLCNKCKFHHHGPCTEKCANCKKVDHLTRDCWNPTTANNQRTITCYECGNQGHYGSDCPELRNQNHGNQAEDTKTHGVVYALGGEETDQDPNNIEDEIEAQEEDFIAPTSEP
ncbi:putative reverse transcriptase domain-containing protein [Tanacetum coccineum]